MLLLAMVLGGCADKRRLRVTNALDQCIGKESSCVDNIQFSPSYDYKRSMYMWEFESMEHIHGGGSNLYYKIKNQMTDYGTFRNEYIKVKIDGDDIVTGYETIYDLEGEKQ